MSARWADHYGRHLELSHHQDCDGNPQGGGVDQRTACADGCLDLDITGPCFHLPLDELTEFVTALYEAAGLPAPVILERPEIDPAASEQAGPFRVWLSPGGDVMVAIGSSQTGDSPAVIRQAAATLAAYADAAETAPDPADVDTLAMLMVEGTGAMGIDGARPLARKILLAGYRREVPDA